MAAVKVGVLGGTFDPIHLGHLALAEHARRQLDLERVIWVPAGEPWRKRDRTISPGEQRCEMVRLAIAGDATSELSTLEVDRGGPSYSVETLATLARDCPMWEMHFVMGLDALLDLPNWREPERLASLATLAVAVRGGQRLEAADLQKLLPGLDGRVVWLDMPDIEVSATDVRRRAGEGASLAGLVPALVERYVLEQGLYQPE